MGAFGIFAVALTVIYLIYYAVMIFLDLNAKPKDEAASTAESFDIGDMGFEQSKAVEETEDGFRVGVENPQNEWDLPQTDSNPQAETTEPKPEILLDATGAPIAPAQKRVNEALESMEEIEPAMCGELAGEVLLSAITTGKPPVKIKKEVVDTTKDELNKGHDRI